MKNIISRGGTPTIPVSLKAKSASISSKVEKPLHTTACSSHSQQTAIVVLRGKQVDTRLGISRSARYDKLNPRSPRFDPTFPKPIKLGSASIGFIQSEIDGWITSRITASRNTNNTGELKNDFKTPMQSLNQRMGY